MNSLSMQQVEAFNRDGYPMLENAIPADTLQQLHDEMAFPEVPKGASFFEQQAKQIKPT